MEVLIAYFEQGRGRRKDLAVKLGLTPGAVTNWRKVPANRLIEVEKITGIPRNLLRPDLFEGFERAA